jgi:hypothetical protein
MGKRKNRDRVLYAVAFVLFLALVGVGNFEYPSFFERHTVILELVCATILGYFIYGELKPDHAEPVLGQLRESCNKFHETLQVFLRGKETDEGEVVEFHAVEKNRHSEKDPLIEAYLPGVLKGLDLDDQEVVADFQALIDDLEQNNQAFNLCLQNWSGVLFQVKLYNMVKLCNDNTSAAKSLVGTLQHRLNSPERRRSKRGQEALVKAWQRYAASRLAFSEAINAYLGYK